jgi:hypothetical protein
MQTPSITRKSQNLTFSNIDKPSYINDLSKNKIVTIIENKSYLCEKIDRKYCEMLKNTKLENKCKQIWSEVCGSSSFKTID